MTACLLFDLDGTLVDTDPIHYEAFRGVFGALGVALDWEVYRRSIAGFSHRLIAKTFLGHVPEERRDAIFAEKEAAFRARVGAIEPKAGLVDFLDWSEARGLKRAIVTNAPPENSALTLRALNLADRFACIVHGEELAHAKPHPLPYLEGLRRLGASAARSVAFEDSLSGLEAATGAELPVVGVTTSFDAETMRAAGAGLAIADFTDPRLRDFVAARTAG